MRRSAELPEGDPMAIERMPASTTSVTPTQEDLIIDDTLSDLERILKYGTGSLALQRLVHAKMIGRVSKLEGCVMIPPPYKRVVVT